jgi:hypothetical protein
MTTPTLCCTCGMETDAPGGYCEKCRLMCRYCGDPTDDPNRLCAKCRRERDREQQAARSLSLENEIAARRSEYRREQGY